MTRQHAELAHEVQAWRRHRSAEPNQHVVGLEQDGSGAVLADALQLELEASAGPLRQPLGLWRARATAAVQEGCAPCSRLTAEVLLRGDGTDPTCTACVAPTREGEWHAAGPPGGSVAALPSAPGAVEHPRASRPAKVLTRCAQSPFIGRVAFREVATLAATSFYPSARPTATRQTDERELAPRQVPGGDERLFTPERCERLRAVNATEYYVLRLDAHCRLLVARRTPLRFESVSAINECFASIERELAGVNRAHYKLLVDTRGGPPSRNDPTFERAIAENRGKLLFGFRKNAAIAATKVGELQIQRYAKADGRVVHVTTLADEAFRYLGVPYHELP
jgi:hypothetical protein